MKKIKVLLIFPQADKETGVFIKNAFNSIGGGHWEDVRYMTDSVNCEVKHVLDPKVLSQEKLTEYALQVVAYGYTDLVFMSRTPSLVHTAKAIRESFPAITRPVLAMWNIDSERDISRWKSLFPLVDQMDYYFTKSQGSVELWHQGGFKNTFPLQQGIDRKVHNIPDVKRIEKWHDVTFLGSLDPWHQDACGRTELITAIGKEFELTYGADITNKAASALYYASKINIGSNHFPEVALSISVRDYKIMGAGGFLLTNRVKDMETLFTDKVHCVYYDSIPDCLDKIKYYLHHDRKREKIAVAGYHMVHEQHGYDDRMVDVLKTCKLF